MRKIKRQDNCKKAGYGVCCNVHFCKNLDVAVRFAKMIKGLPMPFSQLFKFEGEYFMSMDLSGYDEHELEKMSVIADEYADDIIAGG